VEAVNRKIKVDIHNCVGFIQEPKKLKEIIRQIFHDHVTDDIVRKKIVVLWRFISPLIL